MYMGVHTTKLMEQQLVQIHREFFSCNVHIDWWYSSLVDMYVGQHIQTGPSTTHELAHQVGVDRGVESTMKQLQQQYTQVDHQPQKMP